MNWRGSKLWRWLKRLGIGVVACLALLTIVGASYEAMSRLNAHKHYPPKGELVDIGGRKLHLDCRGSGSPTVVFESGSDHLGTLSWTKVHDAIAGITRACAYDRAGIMHSDAADGVRDGNAIAEDLHAALAVAGESAPFVRVGHSLGAVHSLIYAGKYPDQVAGLVFVDPAHPDQMQWIAEFPAFKSTNETLHSAMKALSALSWTGLPRLLLGAGGDASFPPDVVAESKAFHVTSLAAMNAQTDAIHLIMEQAGRYRSLGDRPLVLLEAENLMDLEMLTTFGLSKEDGERFNAGWRRMRADEATWSTRGRHQLVPESAHYIQFDQPDAVIAAVREVVESVRADRRARAVRLRPRSEIAGPS